MPKGRRIWLAVLTFWAAAAAINNAAGPGLTVDMVIGYLMALALFYFVGLGLAKLFKGLKARSNADAAES